MNENNSPFVYSLETNNPSLIKWLQEHSKETIELALSCGKEILEKKTEQILQSLNQEQILQTKKELNEQFKLAQAPLQQQIQVLQTSISQLTGNLGNADKKGQMGEHVIQETILQYFPLAQITETRKEKEEGDFHLSLFSSFSIFVEIKTWSKTIDTAQIEKFQQEIEQSSSCQAGILISVTSNFAKKGSIPYYDFSSTGKLRFYLPKTCTEQGTMNLIWTLQIIQLLFEYKSSLVKEEEEREEKEGKERGEWIQTMFQEVQSSYDLLLTLKKQYRKLKSPLKEIETSISQLEMKLQNQLPDLKEKFELFMTNNNINNLSKSNKNKRIKI